MDRGILFVMLCRFRRRLLPIPAGGASPNVRVVGYKQLDAGPRFKMSIVQSGDHWYLYLGHFWQSAGRSSTSRIQQFES